MLQIGMMNNVSMMEKRGMSNLILISLCIILAINNLLIERESKKMTVEDYLIDNFGDFEQRVSQIRKHRKFMNFIELNLVFAYITMGLAILNGSYLIFFK